MTDDTDTEIPELRADGWTNMITGIGSMLDKSMYTRHVRGARLDDATLDSVYDEDALAARIVDLPADEMTRVPFAMVSPGDAFDWSPITAALEHAQALAKVGDAVRWSRLYGGLLIVFEIADGHDPKVPVDLGNVLAITDVHLVEATYATPASGPTENPITWRIGGIGAGKLEGKEVHKSRVIRFDGVRTSPGAKLRFGRNGWGPSTLDRCLAAVERLQTMTGYAGNLMHELSLPVLKIAGLRKMLLAGPTGPSDVQLVLKSIKDSIDQLHMLALDGADDLVDQTRETTGIVNLLGIFKDAVTWSTNCPSEVLFNITQGGLNTGENAGPFRAWYDRCAKQRGDIVTPAIDRWAVLVAASMKLEIPTVRTVEWEPLWQPTAGEAATATLTRAQSDQIYFTMGAVDENEIRQARFIATQDGGFAVDEPEEIEGDPSNVIALAGVPANTAPVDPEGGTPAPALDVDKALAVMKAAQANEIPRDGAIALLRVAFPALVGVVEQLVPPAPLPVDPATAALEAEEQQADYEPPDTPVTPQELHQTLGVSPAVLAGMRKRGEIGAWKWGARWKYSPTEVKQAGHRPAGVQPPAGPPAIPAMLDKADEDA